MSRRNRSQLGKAFGDTPPPITAQEIDESFYGAFATVDEGRMDAEPVSIMRIYPNPMQPRRAIVSACRHFWNGQPDDVQRLFNKWQKAITGERYLALEGLSEAERQRLSYFDLQGYLEGDDERVNRDYEPGPIEASFLRIVDLAASIRRDGLTNPITVARGGVDFHLETGERRWLAFHLLCGFYDGSEGRPDESEHWSKIPARVVDQSSVWRMANENNVRADLNAIGKARQFGLLMMDLYQQRGYEFAPYDELVKPGGCDRKFYAQVSDGNQYSLRGVTEKLLNAMGFSSNSQMREHRALLDLPDQVWQWADDLDWAQRRIREMTRAAKGSDGKVSRKALVEIARQEAAREGLNVGIPAPQHIPSDVETSPPLPGDGPHLQGKSLLSRADKANLRLLMSLRSGVGEADAETKQVVLDKIAETRRWLDDLESQLYHE
ncbi:MAG: ParB N-terminal domain-containing protein [Anaerolineae bacterium]|nr:ParB N-terminal domain-containing protein [Anaerolineae bacterium]